ncbi:MAG: DVUA0089 family protein [Bryobacteraceae bacterium]
MRSAAFWCLFTAPLFGGTISLTGNLSPDDPNDVLLAAFTLSSTANVSFQSWGYGGTANAPGGTNAAGAVITPGGFDPYLSLFAGAGPSATFLVSNDDGFCPPGTPGPACRDSSLDVLNLAAGTYTAALSVFSNFSFAENFGSGTLGDGFIGLGSYYNADSDSFRNPAYALDITSDGLPVAIPEPGTLGVLAAATLLFIIGRRRRIR